MKAFITSLVLTLGVITLSFFILKIKSIVTFLINNQAYTSNLNSVIMVFTIFSILFAIFTYYEQRAEQRRITRNNNETLVDNAWTEVEINLEIAQFIESHIAEFKTVQGGLPSGKFLVTALQSAVGILKNAILRKNILRAIDEMDSANRIIEAITSFQGPILIAANKDNDEVIKAYNHMRTVNLERYKEITSKAKELLEKIALDLQPDLVEILS